MPAHKIESGDRTAHPVKHRLSITAPIVLNGRVMVNAPQNPGELYTITYTPRANYHGADTFTYRARDPGGLTSSVATVALIIDGVNDDPVFASAPGSPSTSRCRRRTRSWSRPRTRTAAGDGDGGGGPSPSERDFEWTVTHDIEDLDSGHDVPTGSWSDGVILWIAENGPGADDALYAYDLQTGDRVGEREFPLAERNRAPRGVWSDGTTVWVADSG